MLEHELNEMKNEKHKPELNQLGVTQASTSEVNQITEITELQVENTENMSKTEAPANIRASRAQKRRNKKEQEAKEREKRVSEEAEKSRENPRTAEINAIEKFLRSVNLKLYSIPADGNCLYLAINHQLQIKQMPTYTVDDLRKITAEFMLKNKEEFLPFMYNELDESEVVSEEQFEKYCKDVASTKMWGGQLELRALSNIVKCPIKIIQGNGPPTVQGESFKGPELILTYHRHMYRLGEHYNSTVPIPREDEDV